MNKFKTVEELEKAYLNLEKVYTKKCQEFNKLKKMSSEKLNFNVCVLCKYKVFCKGNYLYINEDGDFSEGKIDWCKRMEGFEFIDFLVDSLKDRYFFEMVIDNNSIYISCFNPNSGVSKDFTITYEEIE